MYSNAQGNSKLEQTKMIISEVKGKFEPKVYKVLINNEVIPCSITISDDTESYNMHVTVDDVSKFSKQLELSIEAYTYVMFEILSGRIHTSFCDVQNNEIMLFKTKQIKFFTKQAQKVNHVDATQTIVQHLYHQSCTQKEALDMINKQNNDLKLELQTLQDKLENVINDASKHEKQLYACFIQVLNEKKKYIQHLKCHIDEKKLKEIGNVNVKKKRELLSDSESDNNSYNTDDDKSSNFVSTQKLDGPSTSTCKERFVKSKQAEVSCIFDMDDDSDDEVVLPARANVRTDEKLGKVKISGTVSNNEETKIIQTETKHKEEKEKKQEITVAYSDTPVVTISTQDLLDDIF